MTSLMVFDLDGTLAKSKSPLETDMADLLDKLMGVMKVAVISGGAWPASSGERSSGRRVRMFDCNACSGARPRESPNHTSTIASEDIDRLLTSGENCPKGI